MKVILKADVKGQGKKGQLIEISEGYGRNFLLPRGLAELATNDNINLMRQADEAQARRVALEKQEAQEVAEKLQKCHVTISAKAGTGGRLFGAVTAKEISENLKKQHNIDIAKNKIVLEDAVKAFGTYQVKAKLFSGIVGEITVQVAEA